MLAVPMVAIMLSTGWLALRRAHYVAKACASNAPKEQESQELKSNTNVFIYVLPFFALPQLILAILATTTFHVQIINRISSGYPVWYIVLAIAIFSVRDSLSARERSSHVPSVDSKKAGNAGFGNRKDATYPETGSSRPFCPFKSSPLQWIVRGMVMYAIVQGGIVC